MASTGFLRIDFTVVCINISYKEHTTSIKAMERRVSNTVYSIEGKFGGGKLS